MKPFQHNYKLKLTAISPAHIGDGTLYEPTNYVIDDGRLYYFDDSALVSMLNDQQRNDLLTIVSRSNSYQRLQLFYKRDDIKQLAKTCARYTVPVAKDIEKNYNDSLGKVKQKEGKDHEVFNALSIHATIKTSHTPYIPGSSFKGALKTAFYSKEAESKHFSDVTREKTDRNGRVRDYLFQKRYFGEFERDPFSKVKISDSMPKEPKLTIKWGVNKKKKSDSTENDNTGIRYEFIAPASEFVAEMTLVDRVDPGILEQINARIRDRKREVHQPHKVYTLDEIIQTVNRFYIPKFEEEQRWAERKKGLIGIDYFNRTLPYIQKAKAGKGFLARIGRHSGAVAMTLDGHRQIFIPQMKKDQEGNPLSPDQKYVSSPFTYWLASNVDAVKSAEFIGWFYCEVITDEAYREVLEAFENNLRNQQERRLSVERELAEQEERMRQKQEEIMRREEMEEKRRIEHQRAEEAKRAAMSPLERVIEELKEANPDPNATADIILFNAIKNGELDEFKCEALKLLKEEMQKAKKWVEQSKKPEKDKKYKRTQEVIRMLSEC